jgi:putative oxidoreductase
MAGTSRSLTGRTLLLIGRVGLASIFLYAAYAKLKPQVPGPWSVGAVKTSLSMFAMQVDSYQLLSSSSADFVAHALPFFELFLGLWILSGIALRLSSLASTLLLGGFFVTMVRTYAMGLEINCGCFGPGEHLGVKTLLRDGSILALSIAVVGGAFIVARRRSSPPETAPSSPELQQAR